MGLAEKSARQSKPAPGFAARIIFASVFFLSLAACNPSSMSLGACEARGGKITLSHYKRESGIYLHPVYRCEIKAGAQ